MALKESPEARDIVGQYIFSILYIKSPLFRAVFIGMILRKFKQQQTFLVRYYIGRGLAVW